MSARHEDQGDIVVPVDSLLDIVKIVLKSFTFLTASIETAATLSWFDTEGDSLMIT